MCPPCATTGQHAETIGKTQMIRRRAHNIGPQAQMVFMDGGADGFFYVRSTGGRMNIDRQPRASIGFQVQKNQIPVVALRCRVTGGSQRGNTVVIAGVSCRNMTGFGHQSGIFDRFSKTLQNGARRTAWRPGWQVSASTSPARANIGLGQKTTSPKLASKETYAHDH